MNEKRQQRYDAVARVRLRATEAGGRRSPIGPTMFRCPVFFGDQREQANDCAFFFNEAGVSVAPGGPEVQVPIKFLALELVVEKLKIGARFTLWEGRDVGEAEIVDVLVS
jgi:hypothetical protein